MSNPPLIDERRPYRARNGSVPDAHTVMPAWMFPYRPSAVSRSAAHRIDRVTLPTLDMRQLIASERERRTHNRAQAVHLFKLDALALALWVIALGMFLIIALRDAVNVSDFMGVLVIALTALYIVLVIVAWNCEKPPLKVDNEIIHEESAPPD